MTIFQVLDRVYRARVAFLVIAVAAAVAALSTATTPTDARYEYVPTIGQAVFVCCVAAASSAALLAVPRAEALEVTAARPQWMVRLFVAAALYAVLAGIAAVVCVAADSSWYFGPLLRDMVVVAGVTFALSAVLPSRYVAVAAVAYVLACVFGSRGSQWWDLLLTPTSWQNRLAAATLGVLGAAVFALRGARALPPDDEY
jgi:hypothetical protein